MKIILCDIDGTLADLRHRLHFINGGERDWDGFFSNVKYDGVIAPIARILDGLVSLGGAREHIVLVSGRPERCRTDTEIWLREHAIPYADLLMRADGDHRPDNVVKEEILDFLIAQGCEVEFVIDDRPRVIEMWRRRGMFVLAAPWHGDDADDCVQPGVLSVLVGPSGAGKSEWLSKQCENGGDFGIQRSHVISSDQIRADLCGDFRDQTRNADVFAALHALVRTRVRHGLDTVVDATNIRRRDRMSVVACAPATATVRYFVIDRPLEEKMQTAGWRAAVPAEEGKPHFMVKHHEIMKMNLPSILKGDGLPNVTVYDLRRTASATGAAE